MNGDDVSCIVSTWNENPNENTASKNLFPYFQIGHSSVSFRWSENFQKLTPHPDFQ